MRLALMAMRTFESPRDDKQRRLHIEMMLVSEFSRFLRQAVSACIAAQPEAIAQAFHVRKMDLAPGVVLRWRVPHAAIPTLKGSGPSPRESYTVAMNAR